MYNNCLQLSSLFLDSITVDSMSEAAVASLHPDTTRVTILARSGGVWSYASGSDYDTVAAWMSANSMAMPTVAQIKSLLDSEMGSENYYLTAGEFVKWIVNVQLTGSYTVNLQSADSFGETEAPMTLPRKTTVQSCDCSYQSVVQPTDIESELDIGNIRMPPYLSYYEYATNAREWGTMVKNGTVDNTGDYDTFMERTDAYKYTIVMYDGLKFGNRINGGDDYGTRLAIKKLDGSYVDVWNENCPTGTSSDAGGVKTSYYCPHIAYVAFEAGQDSIDFVVHYSTRRFVPLIGWEEDWHTMEFNVHGDDIVDIVWHKKATSGDRYYSLAGEFPAQSLSEISILGPSSNVTATDRSTYIREPYVKMTPLFFVGESDDQLYNPTKNATPRKRYVTDALTISLSAPSTPNDITTNFTEGMVNDSVTVKCYKHIKPINWAAITRTEPSKVNGDTVAQAHIVASSMVRSDYRGRKFYNPYVYVSIDSENVVISETREVAVPNSVAYNALLSVDTFNADDILNAGDVASLREVVSKNYAVMDVYMQMFADATANYVVATITDAMIQSLTAGYVTADGERVTYPMRTVAGFTDTTPFTINGVTYTCKQLRESDDPDVHVLKLLADMQKDMDYKWTMFQSLHDAFSTVDSLSSFASRIRSKIDNIIQEATLIATAPFTNAQALLLNAGYSKEKYEYIATLIESAISAGYSTLSDAVNYITKLSPTALYYFDDDSKAQLYQELLQGSAYAGYNANVLHTPKSVSSNVSYWGTYQLRLGASILNQPSPDSEFMTTSDGAEYLWPPVISSTVTAKLSDDFIAKGLTFTIPLKSSYVIVHRLYGDVFEIDWCARFAGGNDADLYDAIAGVIDEFDTMTIALAEIYSGAKLTLTHSDLPSGYRGLAKESNIIGCLALLGAGALGGLLSGSENEIYTYSNGAKSLGVSKAGGVIGLAAASVFSLTQSLNPDYNGVMNMNWSTAALVNSSVNLIDSYSLSGYAALNATGGDAVNVLNSVLLWALRYGLIAPFGDYAYESVGYGVLSNGYVTPKYYYIGEHKDYSALMITAGVTLTAAYTRRYLNLNKVRTAAYIPATVGGAAASAASVAISNIISEEDASESDIMMLKSLVTDAEGESVTDKVSRVESYVGTPLDIGTDAVTIFGIIGSMASIVSLNDKKQDEDLELSKQILEASRKKIYRY